MRCRRVVKGGARTRRGGVMWGRDALQGRGVALRRAAMATAAVALCRAVSAPSVIAADPWMDTSLSPDQRVALLVPQMTLQEKVDLMTGDPPQNTGAYFNAAIPRLGIPEMRSADIGPGVRFGSPTTAFPMDIAIAATWNPALAEPLGRA